MTMRPLRSGARVLAVVAAPRYSGAVALDGWGLAPQGFRAWSLRPHRTLDGKVRFLVRRAVGMARAARPVRVVLGIPLVDDWRAKLLRASVAAALRARGVAVAERRLRDTRRLVLGRLRGPGENALPAAVVRGFLPDLAAYLKTDRLSGYYRRNAFEAAALAINELVEIAPRAAAALARPEAFDAATFRDALSASDRRKYPEEVTRTIPTPAKAAPPHAAPALPTRSAAPCLPPSPKRDAAATAAPRPAIDRRPWEGAFRRNNPRTRTAVRT